MASAKMAKERSHQPGIERKEEKHGASANRRHQHGVIIGRHRNNDSSKISGNEKQASKHQQTWRHRNDDITYQHDGEHVSRGSGEASSAKKAQSKSAASIKLAYNEAMKKNVASNNRRAANGVLSREEKSMASRKTYSAHQQTSAYARAIQNINMSKATK